MTPAAGEFAAPELAKQLKAIQGMDKKYSYDIYISYHSNDNRPGDTQDSGWVHYFRHFLGELYSQIFGYQLNLLELPVPDGEIAEKSGLICILSPDYVASKQCLEESFRFITSAADAEVSPKPLVLKVVKYPVAVASQPEHLRPLPGYDLYRTHPETNEVEEIYDFFDQDSQQYYWLRLTDLAYDIYEWMIRGNAVAEKEIPEDSSAVKGTIYLAETGRDLLVQRYIIKRELVRQRYRVLPNYNLPADVKEMEKVVRRDLAESMISIHLIGESYGEVINGSNQSLIDLQNQFAAEHSRALNTARVGTDTHDPAFTRLIWVAPELKLQDEKQRLFIDTIRQGIENFENAQILQTPLENFKALLRNELAEGGIKKNLPAREYTKSGPQPVVYFMYDRVDAAAAAPVIQQLTQKGFQVLHPAFSGNLLSIHQVHIDNLQKMDIAVIYQHQVNNVWLRMKKLDVIKAPGYGRKKPILKKILCTPPGVAVDTDLKEKYDFVSVDGSPQALLNQLKDVSSIAAGELL